MEEVKLLQYEAFVSQIDVSFWHELSKKKLEKFKLSDEPIELQGHLTLQNCLIRIDGNSFEASNSKEISMRGTLYNTNTIESFKELDKASLFNNEANKIWKSIINGEAMKNPRLLLSFFMISFADIKKYKYYYWVAFPALYFAPVPNKLQSYSNFTTKGIYDLHAFYSNVEIKKIEKEIETLEYCPFFLVKKRKSLNREDIIVYPLSKWELFWTDEQDIESERRIGILDSSSLPNFPGWSLRNFLLFSSFYFYSSLDNNSLNYKYPISSTVQVICLRSSHPSIGVDISSSKLIEVQFPEVCISLFRDGKWKENMEPVGSKDAFILSSGWEKNTETGKYSPKYVNLSSTLDPRKLASSSVDLNLQLMQWRLFPQLNLQKIKATKILLFGGGTLGCNVARNIIGWGVRNITIVDNGRVSFSNPVRQSLFEYADCLNGGKFKAEAAVEKLRSIFPDLQANSVVLSIPMPGHPIPSQELKNVEKDLETITKLIKEHDVIYLLTDSRESRWLPTLLAKAYHKLAITVALGFDSFVVMRHGITSSTVDHDLNLGCYFCNDVVAPMDSMKDRTLDQQCTVTRPGLSFISSALSVELLVSLLHHPKGFEAPAENTGKQDTSPLGIVPHSIRGFISNFSNIIVTGHAYDKCTACSKYVLDEYLKKKEQFLIEVFNSPSLLEEITGLTKMKQEADEIEWESNIEDDF